jgi:hypothetical protein
MIAEHHEQQILLPRGLSAAQAETYGVRSILTEDELPEELRDSKYATVPGLLFTWRSPLSGEVLQYRPDEPALNPDGDPVKYLFRRDTTLVLNQLRDNDLRDGPMLLAEGTLQSIAAAAYTHDGWAVYGMSGCWSWRKGDTTVATPDLLVAEGRDVVVALDADAATNLDVYNAGIALEAALEAEGAHSVTFLRLDGHGKKAGLDDVLGARPADTRARYLQRLLERSEEKPAKKAPPRRQRPGGGLVVVSSADRPVISVNADRRDVINSLTDALVKWSGDTLFDYGGIIARRGGTTVTPVTEGTFADLVAEAALTVSVNAKGDMQPAWPDDKSCKATLSRAERFAPLERISQVPFVRADGSICQTPGYDEASASFLVLDEAVTHITVPEVPDEDAVSSAVKLLCEEWLGDLFAIMPEPEDRANCLAMILTPFVRGMVPLVPMAVVDGLQMGVGKNLLADLLSIIAHGVEADPLPYSLDDAENRKVITANFRAGRDLFVFDEAHVIEGPQLAKSITSITYTDRILGVSNMVEFPNRVTWVALGNNVSVNGDLARRVYRIRLAPAAENPQDRDSSEFRHPNLRRWTKEHRHELVAAALTLVRAWFSSAPEGQRVENAAGRRFGSFEQWGGMVGGILDHAGVEGFLGSLVEWRSETDFETQWWLAHLSWLRKQFHGPGKEDRDFTTAEVVQTMKRSPSGSVEHPPRLEDHDARGYNRALGLAYGRVKNRYMRGLQLVKTVDSPGHGNRWAVRNLVTESDVEKSQPQPEGFQSPESNTESPTSSRDDSVTDSIPEGGIQDQRGDTVILGQAAPMKNSCVYVQGDLYTRNFVGEGDKATTVTPVSTASGHSPRAVREPLRLYPSYPPDGSDDSSSDPLESLLPLLPPVPARECPDCDQEEELTPSGFIYSCRACTPGAFA